MCVTFWVVCVLRFLVSPEEGAVCFRKVVCCFKCFVPKERDAVFVHDIKLPQKSWETIRSCRPESRPFMGQGHTRKLLFTKLHARSLLLSVI